MDNMTNLQLTLLETPKPIVTLSFNAVSCTIHGAPVDLLNKIRVNICTYVDRGIAYQNKTNRRKYVNPNICVMPHNNFPTGLLPRVYAAIKNYGYDISLDDNIKAPYIPLLDLPDSLYSHQLKIIQTALDMRRCIIQSPTGSGKTLASAYFLSHFPTQEIMVVVPDSTLLEQNAAVYEKVLNERVGRISGKTRTKKDAWCRVNVGIINSLYKTASTNPELLRNIEVLIIDECHNAGNNKMYTTFCNALTNTNYRLGLSATAWRENGDDLMMEGLLGPIVLRINEEELVGLQKILAPEYCVLTVKAPDVEYDPKSFGANDKPQRHDVYLNALVRNHERNNLILTATQAYLKAPKFADRPGLILVELIEHGELLQLMAQDLGLDIPFISGKTPTKERLAIIDKLRRNEIRILIGSSIFNEGQDVPSLGMGIIAGGGTAQSRIIQQLGRINRTHPGKNQCFVIDFNDAEPYYLNYNFYSRSRAVKERYPDSVHFLTIDELISRFNS